MSNNLTALDLSYNSNIDTRQLLTNVYQPTFAISQSLNGSIISFFERITGDRQSAEILASSVLATARTKNINPAALFSKLKNLSVQEQKYYLNFYLNSNRTGTSLLGSKRDAKINKFLERSYRYYNNIEETVDRANIFMLDAADTLSYQEPMTSWYNILGNNKFDFVGRTIYQNTDQKQYMRFDGTNYATGPGFGRFLTGDITVEVLIKVNQYSSDWVRVIGAGVPSSRIFGLWYYSTGQILYQRIGTTYLNLYVTEKLNINTWVHVIARTFKNTHSLFVNSQKVGEKQDSGSWTNLEHPVTIAYSNFHAYGKFDLAFARLYGRALNDLEVSESYVTARQRLNS